ncbi:hypothetical protein CPB83DRAFT_854119 [Crepidotus variabilis]|uniref:F-box domain-containing protein n=1 Tax=Crepidotus variabilis TaxID=179855 RepID=A0A9P6JPN1_9AGAR|nr:hypothetical protein CPB83DRAFT_854119 [Crepidotus variabilis]
MFASLSSFQIPNIVHILQNGQRVDLATHQQKWTPSEDPRAELSKVEAEVEKVSITLAYLLGRVHDLKAQLNQGNSPFLRILPPEIISEIFVCCLQIPQPSEALGKVDSSIPLRLGAVCSAWRSIAWTTPHLWAAVSLHLRSALTIASQATLLREWLARSGHLPLSIWLSSSEDVPWAVTNAEGILKAINDYSNRWQNVDIRLPSACYRYLPPPEEHLPILQSITLRPPGGQGDRTHRVNIFNTPQLTRLSLQCLYLRSIRFNWEVITKLELESFYVDECLEMLREAINIVEFTVRRILGGDDRHTLPEATIVVPALTTLKIENDKGTDLATLFTKIHTPALRELSFSADNVGSVPVPHMITLLTDSQCSLEVLSLSSCSLPEAGLESLLSTIPSLRELHLNLPGSESNGERFQPLTDRILEKFDPAYVQANQDASVLLPGLEVLSYSGLQSFSWSSMLQMVHSRMTANLAERPSTPPPVELLDTSDLTSSSSRTTAFAPLIKDIYSRLSALNLRIVLFTEEQVAQVPPSSSLHDGTAGLKTKLETIVKLPPPTPVDTAPTTPNNEPAT